MFLKEVNKTIIVERTSHRHRHHVSWTVFVFTDICLMTLLGSSSYILSIFACNVNYVSFAVNCKLFVNDFNALNITFVYAHFWF